jgi:hypothetical protein
MQKITQEKLNEILERHKLWLLDNNKGEYANLSNLDLSNLDLSNANLSYANLSYANLRFANLSKANLSYANLNEANLNEANLSNTNLEYANLSDACLSNTNLSNANLGFTHLDNTDFKFAKNILLFQKPNGRICYAVKHTKKHTNCIMIQAGCFWGTIDEFEKQAIEKYGDDIKQNYQPQVQYLKSIF